MAVLSTKASVMWGGCVGEDAGLAGGGRVGGIAIVDTTTYIISGSTMQTTWSRGT